jgi:glycosyltransferase involved in cell wall biosynthesis
MRLIMVSGDFPPRLSGVGDYAWHVARTAAMMGTEVTIVTTEPKGAPELPQVASLDVRPVMTKWHFAEVNKILHVLRESSARTVVNIQYYCPATYGRQLMINFLPALTRALWPETRIVITMHGFWEQSRLFRLRTLPMLRAAHGVIYVDHLNQVLIRKYSCLAESCLKHIPIAGNIPPIPCTAEQRRMWRQELGLAEGDVAVAFFGGIGRNKGFEYLVEAVERVRKINALPMVLLAIGGFHSDGINNTYHQEVRDLIRRLGLEDCVCVLDSPNSTIVSKCLHAANLAVYPFLNGVGENSGSMLAALAHGLPTVITAGPANDASFAERFGVVMVPAQDSEQLADAITGLIMSPVHRQEMRERALEISSHLNWEFVTRETMDFFASLL